ncbi:hypothetical protein [Actinophytocola sediminis]
MARKIRVDWHGDTVSRQVRRGADRGVAAGAEHVRDVAVDRAPRRTGALHTSARTVQEPGTATAAVTFDADYAVYQHENLDYQHDDGGPKFLETAMVSERGTVARLAQAEIRRTLET